LATRIELRERGGVDGAPAAIGMALAARAVDERCNALQPARDRLTARDAVGFFRPCGYATGIN